MAPQNPGRNDSPQEIKVNPCKRKGLILILQQAE